MYIDRSEEAEITRYICKLYVSSYVSGLDGTEDWTRATKATIYPKETKRGEE